MAAICGFVGWHATDTAPCVPDELGSAITLIGDKKNECTYNTDDCLLGMVVIRATSVKAYVFLASCTVDSTN